MCALTLIYTCEVLPCLQEDGAVHVPLVMACEHGSLEVVKLLLEHNADVNKQSKVYTWNQGRSCTLMYNI